MHLSVRLKPYTPPNSKLFIESNDVGYSQCEFQSIHCVPTSFASFRLLQDTRQSILLGSLGAAASAMKITYASYLRVVNHQQGGVLIYILMCTGSFCEHVVKAGYAVFDSTYSLFFHNYHHLCRIDEWRSDEVLYLIQEEGCRDCYGVSGCCKGTLLLEFIR